MIEELKAAIDSLKRYRNAVDLDKSVRPYGGSVICNKPDFFYFMDKYGEEMLTALTSDGRECGCITHDDCKGTHTACAQTDGQEKLSIVGHSFAGGNMALDGVYVLNKETGETKLYRDVDRDKQENPLEEENKRLYQSIEALKAGRPDPWELYRCSGCIVLEEENKRLREAVLNVIEKSHSHIDGRFLFDDINPRRTLDIKRRLDGVETWHEGDWLTDLRLAILELMKHEGTIRQAGEG